MGAYFEGTGSTEETLLAHAEPGPGLPKVCPLPFRPHLRGYNSNAVKRVFRFLLGGLGPEIVATSRPSPAPGGLGKGPGREVGINPM